LLLNPDDAHRSAISKHFGVAGSVTLGETVEPDVAGIVFEIPGRSDVDVWLKDWNGCPELGNGRRTAGLLINGQGSGVIAELNALAPAAPQRDFVQS
jgi:hypothetical protein